MTTDELAKENARLQARLDAVAGPVDKGIEHRQHGYPAAHTVEGKALLGHSVQYDFSKDACGPAPAAPPQAPAVNATPIHPLVPYPWEK